MKIKRKDWDYVLDCVRVGLNNRYDYLENRELLESEKQFLAKGNEIEDPDYVQEAKDFMPAIHSATMVTGNKWLLYSDWLEHCKLFYKAIEQLQDKVNNETK